MDKAKKIEKKWVVYHTKIGRTPPGVYQRRVSFDEKLAFIHPPGDAMTADILPKENVFDKKEDADRYKAGAGLLRWCVQVHGRREVPEMFQAKVSFHTSESYGGRKWHTVAVVRVDNNEVVTDRFGLRTFEAKRNAESHFRQMWKRAFQECSKELKAYNNKMTDLLANKPRSGKKKLA